MLHAGSGPVLPADAFLHGLQRFCWPSRCLPSVLCVDIDRWVGTWTGLLVAVDVLSDLEVAGAVQGTPVCSAHVARPLAFYHVSCVPPSLLFPARRDGPGQKLTFPSPSVLSAWLESCEAELLVSCASAYLCQCSGPRFHSVMTSVTVTLSKRRVSRLGPGPPLCAVPCFPARPVSS